MLIISLTCLFIVPFVSHVVSSHHEILSLDLVEYVSTYKKVDLDTIHITVIIVMWLALLLANLYYNRFRYDIWNGVSVIAFQQCYTIWQFCFRAETVLLFGMSVVQLRFLVNSR